MKYDYTKALLYAYPMLEELEASLEISVENKALLSYKSRAGALWDATKILEEISRKVRLEELKNLVSELLSLLTEEELYLLEYKYFRRKKVLFGRFGDFTLPFSERSYFRRQHELLSRLRGLFAARGWTEEALESYCKDLPLLPRIASEIGKGREQSIRKKRSFGRSSVQKSRSLSPVPLRPPRRTNTAMATAARQTRQMAMMPAVSKPLSSSMGGSGSAEVSVR